MRSRPLPLILVGGILLLVQALAVGLGSGSRICVDLACPAVMAATDDGCCGGGCADTTPEAPTDQDCGCRWLPIPSEPLADVAHLSGPTPAPSGAAPSVRRLLPSAPARLAMPLAERRPPPHLTALRCVVLTC